ncbi:MucR family transcriptional regulator [Desulfovermiculus halophilus]|jgi:predicted transcriptional regulator|uniref:MucR family transcriptional regulator n=1 Tax=Desulfovermiculus halophilus TaxID=339722 RepID=UPI000484445D|nr:MucR family transcriptional regulator [Desulfovermiculus halophilus]
MEEHVQEALDIVKAQASVRNMTEEEITSMVQGLSKQLKKITEGGAESQERTEQPQEPAVDPKKAIREKSVVCLECGKTFKVLTKRHLALHGLTPEEYKEKWGMKKNTALIAKGLARQRKQKMNEMQLWKRRKANNS